MRLTELNISHYKSVESVDLQDISPITVLVGYNGAGKSNVVDVLRFLRDAVTQGLDHAVSKRGGIGLIRQYSPSKPYRITLQFRFHDAKLASRVSYELTLTSLRDGDFRVEREEGRWTEPSYIQLSEERGLIHSNTRNMTFSRNSEGVIKVTRNEKELPLQAHRDPGIDSLIVGQHLFNDDEPFGVVFGGSSLLDFISNIRFSSIYPNTLRQPAHPDTDLVLKENGANWSSILRHLRKTARGRQALDQIKEMMQVVMPQLEDISTQAVGGFIHPRFKVREANGKVHYFDPSQISDGTLRCIALFTALAQPVANLPAFIAIDEPELGLHPAALALFAGLVRSVSPYSQVILSTQSPALLDEFAADEVVVVEAPRGASTFQHLEPDKFAAWLDDYSLSALYSSNVLGGRP